MQNLILIFHVMMSFKFIVTLEQMKAQPMWSMEQLKSSDLIKKKIRY